MVISSRGRGSRRIALDNYVPSAYNADMGTRSCDTLVLAELTERKGNGSWSRLANDLGISRAYLSDIVRGNRQPGPGILAALGLKRVVHIKTTYHKLY